MSRPLWNGLMLAIFGPFAYFLWRAPQRDTSDEAKPT